MTRSFIIILLSVLRGFAHAQPGDLIGEWTAQRYSNDTISVEKMRLSIWDEEIGKWKIDEKFLTVSGTCTFNGTYSFVGSKEWNVLKLVRNRNSSR